MHQGARVASADHTTNRNHWICRAGCTPVPRYPQQIILQIAIIGFVVQNAPGCPGSLGRSY
eukprot:2052044-Rhodomonas_salina.1